MKNSKKVRFLRKLFENHDVLVFESFDLLVLLCKKTVTVVWQEVPRLLFDFQPRDRSMPE